MTAHHEQSAASLELHCWPAHAPSLLKRAPPMPPGARAGVAVDDWDDLLSMVKARLKRTVGGSHAVCTGATTQEAASRVQASVLECVSALDQLHAKLKHGFARHPGPQAPLSAPPDLASVRKRFPGALATAGSGAVLSIELDDFAEINRSHGHAVGDNLLQIVAKRLERAVRRDDSVSPVGADGFVILLERVSSGAHLGPLASRLFDAISAPLNLGQARVALHLNLGIASFPTDGCRFDELLARAEAAMRRARRSQYGYAFFDRFADG